MERYELGSQVRRAAYAAESSLAEVSYRIHVAHRLGYVDELLVATLEEHLKRVAAPLARLIRSIRNTPAILV